MKAPEFDPAALQYLGQTYAIIYSEAKARREPFVQVSTDNFPTFLAAIAAARAAAARPKDPLIGIQIRADATRAIATLDRATRFLDRPRDHAKVASKPVRRWAARIGSQIILAAGVLSFVSSGLLVYDLGRRDGREERVRRCPSFDGADQLLREEVRGGRLDCLYFDRTKKHSRTVIYGRATY